MAFLGGLLMQYAPPLRLPDRQQPVMDSVPDSTKFLKACIGWVDLDELVQVHTFQIPLRSRVLRKG
jgi:hypothetical protein